MTKKKSKNEIPTREQIAALLLPEPGPHTEQRAYNDGIRDVLALFIPHSTRI